MYMWLMNRGSGSRLLKAQLLLRTKTHNPAAYDKFLIRLALMVEKETAGHGMLEDLGPLEP